MGANHEETFALAATLRYVDPTRPRGMIAHVYAAFAATRLARFISRHVNWKIDPLLLRATRGRLATTLVFPTALLETHGARSGARRRNAIIYFHDGDRVTIAASNAGSPRHPAWYHNLRAHPDVTFGGIPMRATEVHDKAEEERLWEFADRVFPAFPSYRRDAAKANRTIPIIQLTEREPDVSMSPGSADDSAARAEHPRSQPGRRSEAAPPRAIRPSRTQPGSGGVEKTRAEMPARPVSKAAATGATRAAIGIRVGSDPVSNLGSAMPRIVATSQIASVATANPVQMGLRDA